MITRTVCLLMLAMFLLACAPDDIGSLPPERPFGTIRGQAVAGPIANAQVTVYGFGNGVQGTRLGSAQTDDNGAYAVDIQAPSQVVLVEVRGGSYVEEASGTPVALSDEQVLRAVGRYHSGQPLTLMVTPLTHMAVALAEYKIGNGMTVVQAIDEANAEVDAFFAVDVRATTPALITASGEPAAELTSSALYGFYLAGLSNWTLWANRQDPTPRDHADDNSLGLAQILYRDLRSDGLLDGRGLNPDATELVPLAFGTMALDADSYRRAFSLHMLAMANSPRNRTGLAATDLADAAHAIAAQTSLVPDDTPPVTIDGRITGKAATITNAQVTVYGFADGERGRLLGQGQTDTNGNFDITIQAPDQPLLVELTGGDYVEEASDAFVALTEDQVLRAIGHYRSGQSLNLMVTPLTHMAAALAEYKIGNGMAVTQAITEATAAIDQFFALNTLTIRPMAITATGDPLSGVTNNALYGFYLAGLSHWTLWADPEGKLNAISLSQTLYRDLRSDGLLDGRGFNPDATELVPLSFGTVALDADSYRRAFSLHMLAMANSPQNRTGLTVADLTDAAHAIAAQTVLLPDDTPPVAIDGRITGKAAAGAIANAKITVYSLADTERGRLLGSGRTDANGDFDLLLHAIDQPVLVELTGGRYVEEASNTAVIDLAEGQVLRAMGRYRAGQSLTLMLTPMTHMTAALAEYKIGNGLATAQAIAEAETAVNTFFALDVQTTRPAVITTPDASGVDPSAGLPADSLYSLYLAGLSHWALWFSQGDIEGWNSITLSQALYHDLRSDGLLDGRGLNSEATELVPLGFGTTPLDADAYRLAFSLHMLAFSQGARNQSGIATEELLDAARAIAAQTALQAEDATPAPLDAQVPILTLHQRKQVDGKNTLLTLEQFAGKPQSGSFLLLVDIDGPLGADNLITTIFDQSGTEVGNTPPENPLRGSRQALIIVETATYEDGEHTFQLRAVNALGLETIKTFSVKFDNTGPVVTVTSQPSTNQPTITLSGTFSDNIAGVASISVAGQEATLFTDDTWRIEDIAIEPGRNILSISVVDRLGNRRDDFEAVVYRDESSPLITSSGQHGQARFSNGDGSFTTDRLQDSNDGPPLYFDTDRLELGTTLLSRSALDADGIPYFAFAVSDDTASGVPTDAEDVSVRMQYRRNEQILNDWHPLTPVSGEYLIPLASETLAADWHRATPGDQHIITIEVSDPAGNTTTTQFDFYTDIYVPTIGIPDSDITDIGQPVFDATDFADRATLNERAIDSTAYGFRNTTGKAFYISLGDNAVHTTAQTVERLILENRMRKKTTTEWQIRQLTPSNFCPKPETPWANTDYVWNWNGNDWEKKSPPAPTYGPEEIIYSDTFPAITPSESEWAAVPDFDQAFFPFPVPDPTYTYWIYVYDYTLDPTWPPDAAYLRAWSRQLADTGAIEACDPQRYFEQRETYAYESVDGYPKGVLTTEAIADTPDFATTGFTVTDADTGAEIAPASGWYRIAAGQAVTIVKQVTLPTLTLYDEDISTAATYTPRRKDKALTWTVDRGLDITTAHDAGEANIALMPQRNLTVGSGSITYQISR